jgi:hypothetical protein
MSDSVWGKVNRSPAESEKDVYNKVIGAVNNAEDYWLNNMKKPIEQRDPELGKNMEKAWELLSKYDSYIRSGKSNLSKKEIDELAGRPSNLPQGGILGKKQRQLFDLWLLSYPRSKDVDKGKIPPLDKSKIVVPSVIPKRGYDSPWYPQFQRPESDKWLWDV